MTDSPLAAAEELRTDDPKRLLLDARSGKAYGAGHLVGARRIDLDADLAGPQRDGARDGGRHPLPDVRTFAKRVGELGIGPDSRVIVYDDAGGANAAARAWWMLRALGHDDVRVLDGGLQAATALGLALQSSPPSYDPLPPYPFEPSAWVLPTVGVSTVDRVRRDETWRVIDSRAGFRFRGEREPIDPVAGHIPGAMNAFYEESLDETGRFLEPAVLRAIFEELFAGVPPERVVVHCGSGVTACHTLLALEHAGLRGAALYVGSWSEWCRREELPRATDV